MFLEFLALQKFCISAKTPNFCIIVRPRDLMWKQNTITFSRKALQNLKILRNTWKLHQWMPYSYKANSAQLGTLAKTVRWMFRSSWQTFLTSSQMSGLKILPITVIMASKNTQSSSKLVNIESNRPNLCLLSVHKLLQSSHYTPQYNVVKRTLCIYGH